MMKVTQALIVAAFLIGGCQPETVQMDFPELDYFGTDAEKFSDYWYNGEAELTSYQLIQSRYGEDRHGSAVLIFVTEPFSKDKQVKLDQSGSKDEVTVMKSNFTKNFITGIYPYSMMLSTFTPVDDFHFPLSLKSTMSSQEWCGHTFSQFNLNKDNRYEFKGLSYFESEGDVSKGMNLALLEDEVWNKIRINPNKLPTGEFKMIPGSFYSRFIHSDVAAQDVKASVIYGDSTVSSYNLVYRESKRSLTIYFQDSFPFEITGWTEKIDEEILSQGISMERIKSDYWRKNSNNFEYLRDTLGVSNKGF